MNCRDDLTGKIFGNFVVIGKSEAFYRHGRNQYWKCRCVCGNIHDIIKYRLTNGEARKCAQCKRIEKYGDLTGKIFGKWKVLYRSNVAKNSSKNKKWLCECQCDYKTRKYIEASYLKRGIRGSCRRCTYEDLTGLRKGKRVAISRNPETRKWKVLCDCGHVVEISAQSFKTTTSCNRCETNEKIGQKFGKLKFLKILHYNKYKPIGLFKCDCGKEYETDAHSVIQNIKKRPNPSCGCARSENQYKDALKEIGKIYGRLKIKKIIGYIPGSKRILYLCKCKCGNEKILERTRLREINSCGCLLQDRTKGEFHHAALLKNDEARAIRELYACGMGYRLQDLANMFNVTIHVISNIINNKTYKDV